MTNNFRYVLPFKLLISWLFVLLLVNYASQVTNLILNVGNSNHTVVQLEGLEQLLYLHLGNRVSRLDVEAFSKVRNLIMISGAYRLDVWPIQTCYRLSNLSSVEVRGAKLIDIKCFNRCV